MYKAYIYGVGKEYDNFMAIYPLYSSLIQIIAVVASEEQFFTSIDGLKVVQPQEIQLNNMDFVIIAVEKWRDIFTKLVELGIEQDKILRSNIFKLPFFNFEKYIELRKSNITILSNSCIGGKIYNKLALETLSPTKNMYCLGKNFVRFCNNVEYYIKQEMKPLENDDIKEGTIGLEDFFQKGKLDDIVWTFNHSVYAEDAISKWNEHVKKINIDNIAVIMIILNDSDIELFNSIKFEKKIGVYYKNIDASNIIYCPTWNNEQTRYRYMSNWIMFANDFLEEGAKIDWLKFLNGEQNYIRYANN